MAISLPTLANQFPILGAEEGIVFDVGLPPARFGEEFSQYKWFFWISALAALIMVFFIVNLLSSRYGRTFKAVRDNPVAAQLAGINVNKTQDIPLDFKGVMGVPITFLHKFNPDQFEIIKFRKGNDEKDLSISGKCPYFRILIKNKRIQTELIKSKGMPTLITV